MKKISFVLSIHNHQPVGNFDHIFEEAFQKSYLPFINILEHHPQIKVVLHYSGCLLDWLIDKHPELIRKVRKMVELGQIEMLTGGYYEPVLPLLPEWDKINQIRSLTRKINKCFGTNPKGMWLTERVWEPNLPKSLAEAEVEFSLIDDINFKQAGLSDEQLLGHYLTEEEGHILKLFPISQKLRYLIPFASKVQQVFDYLNSIASEDENRLILIGDDGEKFGLWPTTYDWVYNKGWLEEFFRGLEERKDWIKSCTFSEWLSENKALGRIYLPCGSYAELMEWALPAQTQLNYEDFIQRIKDRDEYDEYASFIKGGFFRNFLVKYPESNNMHKKMLYVSEKIDKLFLSPEFVLSQSTQTIAADLQPIIDQARDELWQGQCNCAYWHGIFGGLYLPHLRRAVYEHLIKAELIIDQALRPGSDWLRIIPFDFNRDGEKEVMVNTSLVNLYFDPHKGGSLFEFDYKLHYCNLINTLSRKQEAYYQKLRQISSSASEGQIKSIHDQVLTKENGLEKHLCLDWHPKACLLDHFLHSQTTLEGFSRVEYEEVGDFINQPYLTGIKRIRGGVELDMMRDGRVIIDGQPKRIELRKRIILTEKLPGFEADYLIFSHADNEIELIFGIEFNLILPSANSDSCYYYLPELDKQERIDARDEFMGIKRIMLNDDLAKLKVELEFSQEAKLWSCPIETVSYSEAGFEQGYQGSTLLPLWRLHLLPGRFWETKIKMRAF